MAAPGNFLAAFWRFLGNIFGDVVRIGGRHWLGERHDHCGIMGDDGGDGHWRQPSVGRARACLIDPWAGLVGGAQEWEGTASAKLCSRRWISAPSNGDDIGSMACFDSFVASCRPGCG